MVHGKNYVAEELKKYATKVAGAEARWLRKLARKHGLVLLPTQLDAYRFMGRKTNQVRALDSSFPIRIGGCRHQVATLQRR
jgi:hypothetical protein